MAGRGRGVVHVVLAHLARGIGQAVGEHAGGRIQQQPRRLDGVTRHADHARLLQLLAALVVHVEHAIGAALLVVLDLQHHGLGAQLDLARGLGARHLGVERGPLGANLAALHAKADLLAGGPPVIDLAVRCGWTHDVLVTHLAGTGIDHLVVVVRRHRRQAAGLAAAHAHLLLRQLVVRLQLGQRDRPVKHVGPVDGTVGGPGVEVMLLETQGHAGPMHRGAAHALDDPGRQVRIGLGVVPAAGRDALVQPRDLVEHRPFVVLEVGLRVVLARLQNHALDAALRQFVGQCAAARARATITTTLSSLRENFA